MAVRHKDVNYPMNRRELLIVVAQLAAILLLFLVAFFGRDYYGDSGRNVLVVLSSAAGGVAVAGGLMTLYRALRFAPSRGVRALLAGLQIFVGGYTIIHVLL